MRRSSPVWAVFEQTKSALPSSALVKISSAPDTAPTLTEKTLFSGTL